MMTRSLSARRAGGYPMGDGGRMEVGDSRRHRSRHRGGAYYGAGGSRYYAGSYHGGGGGSHYGGYDSRDASLDRRRGRSPSGRSDVSGVGDYVKDLSEKIQELEIRNKELKEKEEERQRRIKEEEERERQKKIMELEYEKRKYEEMKKAEEDRKTAEMQRLIREKEIHDAAQRLLEQKEREDAAKKAHEDAIARARAEAEAKAKNTIDLTRPTYTRFSKKHMCKEALMEKGLPFDEEPDYFIVKQWVDKDVQNALWERTRVIRSFQADWQIKFNIALEKAPIVRTAEGPMKYVSVNGAPAVSIPVLESGKPKPSRYYGF